MKHLVPLSSLIVGLIFFLCLSSLSSSFKADEVGLGRNTTSHVAYFNNKRVSGISDRIDSVLINISYQKNTEKYNNNIILWFGNSQLHAINYYKPGDHLAVEYANINLAKNQVKQTIYQFSCPHLNFIEELVFLAELKAKNITPNTLIIPVTYRSFHFSTIRNELKNLSGYQSIETLVTEETLKQIYRYEKESDERGKLASKEKTWQDHSEETLNSILSEYFPLYEFRENTKSFIGFFPLQAIHFFADKTKDLNVKGKDETVDLNKKAFATLLDYAKHNNIKVIAYQVPHPQDSNFFFYNKSAYHAFFEDIKSMSANYANTTFLDLSTLVELDLWGINNDGYKDTYHFKDKGHKLLGDTIAATLKTILN